MHNIIVPRDLHLLRELDVYITKNRAGGITHTSLDNETAVTYFVMCPGRQREDITMLVQDQKVTLTFAASKRHGLKLPETTYTIFLPNTVSKDEVSAALADGVLRITCPKRQPRNVTITQG